MCAADTPTLSLTRRALARGLVAQTAVIGLAGQSVAAPVSAAPAPAPVSAPVITPALRDAALRGLALAGYRGDPVTAEAAREALAQLTETDPEAALLLRLYRKLDVRPSQYRVADAPDAGAGDLAVLHQAVAACRPVRFAYTDMQGDKTRRAVLPLALVHPPQGVKLLAYCLAREDYRQFFVRAMQRVRPLQGDFTEDRMALLEGLALKEGA